MKPTHIRWLRRALLGVAGIVLFGAFALACTYLYLAPSLPTAETMRKKELAVPLRVRTRDGQLVSQFGEERRITVRYEDIPLVVRQAVMAAEDDRFFEHHGLDWMGLVRALVTNVVSGGANQGGSTITQQTVKYMYLTRDKTLRRKAAELFLTYRMEKDFSKEQILAAYLNVIPYGQRSFGIAAAAETYYGKRLPDLTVAQAATLAGIGQRPSAQNPVKDPKAAEARRAYVLRRMKELGYIDEATATAAASEPVAVASRSFALLAEVEGAYAAELARQFVVKNFGEDAVNAGYTVYTTLDGVKQNAANHALRRGLMDYDQRHGYRGRIGKVELSTAPTEEELDEKLAKFNPVNELLPAVVTRLADSSAEIFIRDVGSARIDVKGMSWAKLANGTEPKRAADVLKRGDVIYVTTDKKGKAELAQLPEAQAALVALDPHDGAVVAMVGGFDFYNNAFNRVTQAKRQPGSSFKPILYSAALDNCYTAASIIPDLPLVYEESADDEERYRPENSSGDTLGPIRLRQALVKSRNLVSLRILQQLSVDTVIDYAARFGFDPKIMPHDITLALGTQLATPLQMATSYAVFANGGYKVDPYLITRVEDESGKVVFEASPKIVCADCELPDSTESSKVPVERRAPRVISAQNAWLTSDILHDVATVGTGKRTNDLGRDDLAGKTGTTQHARDNWWSGFNSNLVASVWVGYDDERSLGEREEGASTAVPLWNMFMEVALKGMPSARMPRPEGIIEMKISPDSGEPLGPLDPGGMIEYFITSPTSCSVPAADGTTRPGSATPIIPVKPTITPGGEPLF